MRCIYLIPAALIGLGVAAIATATSHAGSGRPGQAVFEANCANCHTGGFGGFFTGAPKVGDRKDWQELTPKGIEALTASTLAGIGDMAARGECTVCTDEEIRAAVEYMLEQSQ